MTPREYTNCTHRMSDELKHYSDELVDRVLVECETSLRGLTEGEARARLTRDGHNVISDKKEVPLFVEFLSHFTSPLILILLAAAGISAYVGEIKNLVIIFTMVLASVVLDFFEEHSANDAAKKLRDRVKTTATVIRDGTRHDIHSSHVCVGDLIFLSSGDLVPADARIIEADDFFVNQSSLTGESFPREKLPDLSEHSAHADNDLRNIVFHGTNVVSGTATAVVLKTGKATQFGKVAGSLLRREEKSEFEHGIARFGYFIMRVVFVLVLLIFLGNAVMHGDVLQSFIFAIAIAVGMTPELLPVIMSVTMARGAKRMAKCGVVVKKLSAIPNFGSMDVLCTDKTGTLTEDHIELVLYTDVFGDTNEDVFRYTYLNSAYQTGVRNPLDRAVLEYRTIDLKAYRKTEEIPFDFYRKMMSVAVLTEHGRTLITKGAPEAVMKKCTHYAHGGRTHLLSVAMYETAVREYERLSADGYRVLAIAVNTKLSNKEKYTVEDENGLTLVGFVSFLDPAKKDVRGVLQSLHEYGVVVKVITGDNELVTEKVCRDIGMEVRGVLLGQDIASLTDDALAAKAEETTIFARFSPDEKNRVISALRSRGHVVGYLGDGINDAPSLKAADIGISVDNAVDVAKETADIILTKKHLKPIIDGVIEGRKAFGNTTKYIMMSLSSNFGNMFSVLGAIIYLPFLPMLPIQVLLNNFIYDFSQVTISSDTVEPEWVKKPRKWNLRSIKKFMYTFGPVSSLFDFLTFYILFALFKLSESAFQTGWFMESLATQALVIHVVRTRKLPLVSSRASSLLTVFTVSAVVLGWCIPYTPLGDVFGFSPLPLPIVLAIAGLVVLYLGIVEVTKRVYYRVQGE